MFEDIQDYDLLLVLPASSMARRNHGTRLAPTILARAYLQAKLCVFLTGSAVLLCVLIALSWRAYGALSAARVVFRRPRHVARIGASISQLTSVSRGMLEPCMPWNIASQPMAACAKLSCRPYFATSCEHCDLLLAEKQRRSAIGTRIRCVP